MITLQIEQATLKVVKALRSVIEDSKYYSYELSRDHYGRYDISVDCPSYECFRRIVSVMDEVTN